MEKMESPLFDVIPRLLAGKKTRGGKIPFGNVAARLLDCLEALHETGFIFVDVKPENFMLSKDGKTLADKIRMIDFGLIQPVKSIHGHRPNEGASSLVGTPLYSSLNVHDGQTHSRRDDLEALGYIVSELLIKLVAAANGQDHTKVTLPWSHGTSDEHIGELKMKELTSTKSQFFDQMGASGNAAVEQVMRDYFSAVRAMNYKMKPDYESLREMLLSLDVVAATKKKPASPRKTTSRAKKAATPSTETRTSTRSRAKRASSPKSDEAPSDEDAPAKIRRIIAIDDEYYDTKEAAAAASVDNDYMTARDEATDMDWEPAGSDENQAPRLGIKVLFLEGPHEGESFSLIKKETETVYLGSNPTAKGGDAFALSGDRKVDDTHIKIVLQASKRLQAVLVTDLTSSKGTQVNGIIIPAQKERQVFINDTIKIGDSTMKILKLAQEETPRKQAAKMPAVVRARNEEFVSPLQEEPVKTKAKSSGAGVRVIFTEGPSEIESFILVKDGTTRIVIGSNPVAKSGEETLRIADSSIDATHARLDLNYARKLCTVTVTDLKSSSGTFVNSARIASGKDRKAFMNDIIQIGDQKMQIKTL